MDGCIVFGVIINDALDSLNECCGTKKNPTTENNCQLGYIRPGAFGFYAPTGQL